MFKSIFKRRRYESIEGNKKTSRNLIVLEPLLSIVCKSKNTNVPEEVRLVVLQILLANGADPNQLDSTIWIHSNANGSLKF